jgi:glutamate synthase (NADPH/NADH) small chain
LPFGLKCMDQKELRELEYRCIQEEPPECNAACPIHLDARLFVKHVRDGRWSEAWKVLRKSMPFPGILGRLCEAPCKERCKRGEVDAPIEVGLIERACVSTPPPVQRLQKLPKKDKRIAVVGSDLSSLTAAWDLARKGYRVSVFEPGRALGGGLREIAPERLPREVIAAETAVLDELGVALRFQVDTEAEGFLDEMLGAADAVYLGLDGLNASRLPLARNGEGRAQIDPSSRMTSREGVFAGGLPPKKGERSNILQAAEGRWAATSIDRYLQKVSMTAGREKEGPYPTRLFTSIRGVAQKEAIRPSHPEQGYTSEEAREEAERCLQCECLECVKLCAYLEKFGAYPKRYAREIYNNASIVMGARQANKLVNSCSLCGLCEAVCPEDFAMQDLCLEARREMVAKEKMPPSAHEFALLDMAFSNGDRFLLVRHAPDRTTSGWVFFPGCQLSGSSPGQVRRVYEYLRRKLEGGVGLMLGCCSAPAHWAGRESLFKGELSRWRSQWDSLGQPKVILACSTCYQMLKENVSEAEIFSLWQVMVDIGLPERRGLPPRFPRFAVHDPCTTRHEPSIQKYVRRILEGLGQDYEELVLGQELTECCGYGGLMQNANPEIAAEVARRRANLSDADYLAYCAVCRDNLAAAGKRAVHLLDLLFPEEETPDPAARKRPDWSRRQENRARLKETLLKDLWFERPREMEEYERIVLHISPDVRAILDKRRILKEDVQKVIHHAEKSGERFFHAPTGHYKAAFKPYKVTFWVEYTPAEEGYAVRNAYCHRMEIQGERRS